MSKPDIVKQLSNITVDEISLVDRGANQHAKVLISKRLDEVGKGSPTASGVHHEEPLTDKDRKKKKRFANDEDDGVTVLKADDDDEDDLAALLEAVAARRKRKRMSTMEMEQEGTEEEGEDEDPLAALTGDEDPEEMGEEEDPEFSLDEDEDSFQSEPGDDPDFGPESAEDAEDPENPEDVFDPDAELGADEELGDQLPGEAEAEDEPKPMPGDLPEEVSEYVSELERTVDELERRFKEESKGEVGKADTREQEEVVVSDIAKNEDGFTQEEVSFLEELSKSFESGEVDADEVISKALEEVQKAQARAEEATELAKAERDLRVTREHIAKVTETYPHLPVPANELGPVLKAAQESLSEEHFETLEKALAANEAITKSIKNGEVSLFSEVGKRGGANPAGDEVEAEADAMVEKGEAKTREEAIAKLYATRPELYDEYLSENEAQVR